MYKIIPADVKQGRFELASAVDHIIPHKLEQAIKVKDQAMINRAQQLFWNSSNWQGLCNTHHSSTKQRIENKGTEIGCDINGMPYGGYWIKEK
jgi:HNH endonuclease.